MSEPDTRATRRALWSTLLVVALILVAGFAANTARANRSEVGPAAPTSVPTSEGTSETGIRNAIVFVVDDMSDFTCPDTRRYLPRTSKWLLQQGTCYANATVATPVCCPARAQIQTGQLAHNNGVRSQVGARNLDGDDTVQHDLGDAGLDTYAVGKFLNGLYGPDLYGPDRIDSGFDHVDFWSSYRYEPGRFNLYDRSGNAYQPHTGLSTTETSRFYLDRYLDEALADGRSFYAYDAFFAPHKQTTHADKASLPVPSPESARKPVPPFRFWPERQADDKLPMFHSPTPQPRWYYYQLYKARVQALYDVDAAMASVFERLEDAGVLDETAVIFTSDNGYSDRGQFNWDGKSAPYPAAMNIPMLAYYPGHAPALDERDVSLIDIAPTLYDLLGVQPDHVLDGHSLLGDHVRDAVYGEFFHEDNAIVGAESGHEARSLPTWKMIRRGDASYVEWYRPDGSVRWREYYEDAAMKRNLLYRGYGDPRPDPAAVRQLRRLMYHYAECAGTEEAGSPRPCT